MADERGARRSAGHHAIAALALGLVERGVGCLQHFVGLVQLVVRTLHDRHDDVRVDPLATMLTAGPPTSVTAPAVLSGSNVREKARTMGAAASGTLSPSESVEATSES